MFEELDELKAHLDSLRPIDPDRMSAVKEKLRIDWTYNSNAIEGNTLTLQETAFFIREGLTSKGKPLSEFLEAKDHVEAIAFLEEVVRESRPLTERLIKDFHAIIMQDNKFITVGPPENRVKKRVEPGNYKYDNNHVVKLDGTVHFYTDHLQVPGEMESLIRWCDENRETTHPVELAARLHHRLVAIHPFTDGNGRVSRLVMNLLLMQAGYEPAIIKNEDRMEYYDALDVADKGEYGPFVAMVEREAYRTMKMVVDVAEGREAFGKEDLRRMVKGFAEKVGKLDKDMSVVNQLNDVTSHEHVRNIIASLRSAASEALAGLEISDAASFSLAIRAHDPDDIYSSLFGRNNSQYKWGIEISLNPTKFFVPRAIYYIAVLPTRYYLAIMAFVNIHGLGLGEDSPGEPGLIKKIEISSTWGDYDIKVVDDFFIETFKVFIKSVDNEVEARRRTISEQNNG